MSSSENNGNLRRWVLLFLLAAFTWLVVSRFTDFTDLVSTLEKGHWFWITVAVVLHILYFYLNAVMHKYSFDTVGVRSKATELFPVLLSAIFVNAVAPSGGTGGAALFVDYAVRKGQSGGRAAVGVVLALITDLVTLIPFILWGVFFLASNRDLKYYEAIGFLFFLIFVFGLSGVLMMAHWRPNRLHDLFSRFQGFANRVGSWFRRPNILSQDWASHNANEFIAGANAISNHPRHFAITMGWGIAMHIVNLTGLYAFFIAYQQPVIFGTLVAAFALGIVFFIISIIPQGVGAVEGIMTLVFISMGVPRTSAVVISLAFRGVNFWLPLIAGFIFLRRVTSYSEEEPPAQPANLNPGG